MTVKVGDGQHRGYVTFADEEHAEGKAVKDGASDVLEHQWELQRPSLDSLKRRADLTQEAEAQVGLLTLVPRSRPQRVEFGFRPNDQFGHLPGAAKSRLHAFDNFPPRAGLDRKSTRLNSSH